LYKLVRAYKISVKC